MAKDVNDWKAHENMIREYTLSDITTKITEETNEDYTLEFVLDSDGLYIKTYFSILKKELNEWKAKMQGNSEKL